MSQIPKNEHIKELTIKRLFNAKREIVFKMWTEPEHVSKWFGPKGFTVENCVLELKPGGQFLVNMKRPDGKIYPSTGIFREILPPDKLVFSLVSHFDDDGNPLVEMLNELTFSEENGKTKMVMHIIEIRTVSDVIPLQGLEFAWNQSFDKLSNALAR